LLRQIAELDALARQQAPAAPEPPAGAHQTLLEPNDPNTTRDVIAVGRVTSRHPDHPVPLSGRTRLSPLTG
jgi:hypothetical protein